MLGRIPDGRREGERQLTKLFRSLAREDRSTLIAFAQFLAERGVGEERTSQGPLKPDPIPRPPKESVVGAIKRLSRSYFMLDRSAMLNDTSALMGAHVLQGRSSDEVIDELESLFARYYEKYREELEKGDI